jgi:3-deoxy-D-manno-octulosonate 8-phosphate phosphatase (KDO 8-P phosphatase)
MEDLSSIERRASRIRLLLMDCDGVLTDGRLWLTESGEDQKAFNTRDGLGLELLHRAGLQSGIITGRSSMTVERRAKELSMTFVRQGVKDKLGVFTELLEQGGYDDNTIAYIGDDLTDIPLILRSELGVAVADAAEETRAAAHYITQARGGLGAVREVVEIILKAQGKWSELVKRYHVRL